MGILIFFILGWTFFLMIVYGQIDAMLWTTLGIVIVLSVIIKKFIQRIIRKVNQPKPEDIVDVEYEVLWEGPRIPPLLDRIFGRYYFYTPWDD
jgi:hypothetical protein